jgi:hypothetical protein
METISLKEGIEKITKIESQFKTKTVHITASDVGVNGKLSLILDGKPHEDENLLKSLCKVLRYDGLAKDAHRLPPKETQPLLQGLIKKSLIIDVVYFNDAPCAIRRGTDPVKVSQLVEEVSKEQKTAWDFNFVSAHGSMIETRLTDTTRVFELAPKDVWNLGISINRDFGRRYEYDIRAMLYRLICTNGAIATRCTYRFNSVKEADIKNATSRMLRNLEPVWDSMRSDFKNTAEITIRNVPTKFEEVARLMHLHKEHKDGIKPWLSENMNFYDFHNTLTQYAQKLSLKERRVIETRTVQMVNQVAGAVRLPFYRALFTS